MVKTDDDLQGICERILPISGKLMKGFSTGLAARNHWINRSQHSLPDISTKYLQYLQYNDDRLNSNKQPRLNNIKAT